MKKSLFVFSLILTSLMYGCGNNTIPGNSAANSSTTNPVVQNGLSSVQAPQAFIGTWTGYLNNSYTAIVIQPNGSITINSVGELVKQRILFLQSGRYYIVNPEARTGVPVRVSGTALIVTLGGADETFTKN